MSNDTSLTVEPRENLGKQGAKQLRRSGWIPAVIYGGEADSVPVKINEQNLEYLLRHTHLTTLIDLTIEGGESTKALVRDAIRHPLTDQLVHIDLLRVTERSRVHISVPVELIGEPVGIEEGGVLDHVLHELSIECAAMNIPDTITVDVSGLSIGDNVSVSDLEVPDGIRVLTDSDQTVATVSYPEIITEETEEEEEGEELTEPELVGAEDEDEDSEDDEDDE